MTQHPVSEASAVYVYARVERNGEIHWILVRQ